MTISPRIYQNGNLKVGAEIELNSSAANHISNVLRLKKGAPLIIFNGKNGEYSAQIKTISKQKVIVFLEKFHDIERESPLKIHLIQAISKGEKMDFVMQKATELGVKMITPMITKRCNVKLSQERWKKKLAHWNKIIVSSCEQCGRNCLPILNPIIHFSEIKNMKNFFIFDSNGTKKLSQFKEKLSEITLLIGPEGGLSDPEITAMKNLHAQSISFGPRILRTETAALAAIATFQSRWGDLS